jgi:hypothetical protein
MIQPNRADQQTFYRLVTGLSAQATDTTTRGTALTLIDIRGSVESPRLKSTLVSALGDEIWYQVEWDDQTPIICLTYESAVLLGLTGDVQVKVSNITQAAIESALITMLNILLQKSNCHLPAYLAIRQQTFRL